MPKGIIKKIQSSFFSKKSLVLFSIVALIFLIWSRFFLLNIIPGTLPHDEMVYAVQAKSFVLQGKTLNHQKQWWDLKTVHPMYSEWPSLVMVPGFLFTNDALVAAHVSSAIMGVLLPFLLAKLCYNLWRRKDLSISIWFVSIFNPLLWQFSRLSYDAFFSLWFYVVGGIFFTQKKSPLVLLSIPFFIFGFFQYQGFKLLLLPWLALLLVLKIVIENETLSIKNLKSNTQHLITTYKYHAAVLVIGFILVAIYGLVLLPNQSGVTNRIRSTIFSDSESFKDVVDTDRKLSIANPLLTFSINKATATLHFVLVRLTKAYDPVMLFITVESASGFSVWSHGLFYWVEGVGIVVGLIGLLVIKKYRVTALILVLAIIGMAVPALINTGSEWYLLRTMMGYLLLILISAWGFTFLYTNKRSQFLWIIIPIYVISILNFSYIYFYRYPVISLDWGNFDERITTRYLDLVKEKYPDKKIIIYTPEPHYFFWSYLVYGNNLNKENFQHIADQLGSDGVNTNNTYEVNSITFTDTCYTLQEDAVVIAGAVMVKCENILGQEITTTAATIHNNILAINDSGNRLSIYNDPLCDPLTLTSYQHLTSLNDLQVENMSADIFCSKWIKHFK